MKTMKFFKFYIFNFLAFAILLTLFSQKLLAQEKEKTKSVCVKVNVEADGVITKIDTSFKFLDDADIVKVISLDDINLDIEDVEEKLKNLNITIDLDEISLDNLDDSLFTCKVVRRIKEDGEEESTRIIYKSKGKMKVIRKPEGVFIIKPGSDKLVNVYIDEDIEVSDSLQEKVSVRIEDGDIFVTAKVMIINLDEGEIEELEETGVKFSKSEKDDLEIDDIEFYPNPNTGQFQLKFSLETAGDVKIRIYDLTGREVYSENLESFSGYYEKSIDISDNSDGTYFLHIVQGNSSAVKKIILH